MISPPAKDELENKLRSFERTDSTQVVILTVPSLEGEVLEEFSMKAAESWKIGQKQKDNGVILLVARAERKIRIEVGRGLEGRLTDLMSGRIIDLVIKPSFKRRDYDGGLVSGVHAIIDATRGEFKAEEKEEGKGRSFGSFFIPFVFFLFFGIVPALINRFRRGGSRHDGGLGGMYMGGGGFSSGGFGGGGGGDFGGGGASGDW